MKWFEKLKFARKVTGFSQRDVAMRVNISEAHLSEIENGKIADPSYFKIGYLLALYNLDSKDIKKDRRYDK